MILTVCTAFLVGWLIGRGRSDAELWYQRQAAGHWFVQARFWQATCERLAADRDDVIEGDEWKHR